ncbi:MAG: hypothetical protein QOK21_2417 [Solirubrobacteraceae bacterium]|jgi:hypothetical protein|nr:hypothetical protein [Solirubrobacteraceae bacterium]
MGRVLVLAPPARARQRSCRGPRLDIHRAANRHRFRTRAVRVEARKRSTAGLRGARVTPSLDGQPALHASARRTPASSLRALRGEHTEGPATRAVQALFWAMSSRATRRPCDKVAAFVHDRDVHRHADPRGLRPRASSTARAPLRVIVRGRARRGDRRPASRSPPHGIDPCWTEPLLTVIGARMTGAALMIVGPIAVAICPTAGPMNEMLMPPHTPLPASPGAPTCDGSLIPSNPPSRSQTRAARW